jgi:hypothetical protein
MRAHEVPTHLHVEDHLMAGLTVRQALYVVIGGALAYWLWQNTTLPLGARAAGAAVAALVSLALAIVRPDDQSLATWCARVIAYALTPRRAVWGSSEGHVRRSYPDHGRWPPRGADHTAASSATRQRRQEQRHPRLGRQASPPAGPVG